MIKVTNADLRCWIDSEGGIESLILHGVPSDMEFEDAMTESMWYDTVALFEPFKDVGEKLMAQLEADGTGCDGTDEAYEDEDN